eukprot:gnl/Chilomastix_caulleri/5430.p1 GENE.gnl/Chilomastix_caulleri/5430~~gnl/Chilomastix_caulleri/5430.p1  ORF type:complete len:91 (-),score=6.47 gnl/Chilomastix_caulleri/5430:87-359(-)
MEFQGISGREGLNRWIEKVSSNPGMIDSYISSMESRIGQTEEFRIKMVKLIHVGLFFTNYLVMYNGLGTHILEQLSKSPQMEYYKPFFIL